MMIIITFYERLLEFVLADIFLLQGTYFNYTQMNINRIQLPALIALFCHNFSKWLQLTK